MVRCHTVVLMSGGIDSSAVVFASRKIGASLSGVFVDYGHPTATSEWKAAQCIAEYYNIDIKKVNLSASLLRSQGEYFGRNAFLILLAAGVTKERPLAVAIGIHSLSDYYDTTPLFVRDMNAPPKWLL